MYQKFFKPIIDNIVAIVVLLFLLPFLLLIGIIIKLTSSGPVFFTQSRAGKGGKVFQVFKFRTMYHKNRIVKDEILKDNIEVTKIGFYLRRFKIDELPQVLNILLGDMSIVGPRPCLPCQLPDLDENGRKRLLVKPGLTGMAQINGNIYLSWKERWKYDRKYVENLSFLNDLSIVFKTVAIVFFGEEKFVNKPTKDV